MGTARKGGRCPKSRYHNINCCRGKMANHSSRGSDGSRPTDDTGRGPEVPAGVGPIINMQRGKAKDSFLADIAAHDGD